MKIAWLILLIKAATNFIITAGTAIMATSGTSAVAGQAVAPSSWAITVACIGGLIAAAQTILHALEATPENSAALAGLPAPVKELPLQEAAPHNPVP